MSVVRRLTDSCLLVTTDTDATLFDPGFHTFGSGEFDLGSIGDVTRVVSTHEHTDHASPEFVSWLIDRHADLVVYSNPAVASILSGHEVEVDTSVPARMSIEDVLHDPLPTGAQPPNRAFTIDGLFTHPGDSRQVSRTAPVLALPAMAPWGSVTGAVRFAKRLAPAQVIPIHDFYLTRDGRDFVGRLVELGLADGDVEVVTLGWGDKYTI